MWYNNTMKQNSLKKIRASEIAEIYTPVHNPNTGRLNINYEGLRTGSPRPAGPANKPAARLQEWSKTPDGREKLREMQRKSAAARSANAKHKPKGYPLDVWKKLKKDAVRRAERIVANLNVPITDPFQNSEIDTEALVKQALQVAVEIMLLPVDKNLRISAAKLVLEYTQPKPPARSHLSVSQDPKAFLQKLANEIE